MDAPDPNLLRDARANSRSNARSESAEGGRSSLAPPDSSDPASNSVPPSSSLQQDAQILHNYPIPSFVVFLWILRFVVSQSYSLFMPEWKQTQLLPAPSLRKWLKLIWQRRRLSPFPFMKSFNPFCRISLSQNSSLNLPSTNKFWNGSSEITKLICLLSLVLNPVFCLVLLVI